MNVYNFNEARTKMSIRDANIKIVEWYATPPDVTQILFIIGTEDLCFVESSGRVRVFSLIRGAFLPSYGEFPPNCEVRCSPDGACLIAFTGQDGHRNYLKDTAMDLTSARPSAVHKEENVEGHCDAHVYFLSNLRVARKIVRLSLTGSIQKIRLSLLAGLQSHLLYINSSNEHWSSVILKITTERNVSNEFSVAYISQLIFICQNGNKHFFLYFRCGVSIRSKSLAPLRTWGKYLSQSSKQINSSKVMALLLARSLDPETIWSSEKKRGL